MSLSSSNLELLLLANLFYNLCAHVAAYMTAPLWVKLPVQSEILHVGASADGELCLGKVSSNAIAPFFKK